MPHGRAFAIHHVERFCREIMPRYFKQSRLSSFQRQLNIYGFSRITTPEQDSGEPPCAYYHELFLKGRPALTIHMRRVGVPQHSSGVQATLQKAGLAKGDMTGALQLLSNHQGQQQNLDTQGSNGINRSKKKGGTATMMGETSLLTGRGNAMLRSQSVVPDFYALPPIKAATNASKPTLGGRSTSKRKGRDKNRNDNDGGHKPLKKRRGVPETVTKK